MPAIVKTSVTSNLKQNKKGEWVQKIRISQITRDSKTGRIISSKSKVYDYDKDVASQSLTSGILSGKLPQEDISKILDKTHPMQSDKRLEGSKSVMFEFMRFRYNLSAPNQQILWDIEELMSNGDFYNYYLNNKNDWDKIFKEDYESRKKGTYLGTRESDTELVNKFLENMSKYVDIEHLRRDNGKFLGGL